MQDSLDKKQFEHMVEYLRSVPYDVHRKKLYDAASLYAGYDAESDAEFCNCYDSKVYSHYIEKGKYSVGVEETFGRTLHDYGIRVALDEFFKEHDGRRCIGIMGGHALLRTDKMYRDIVFLCKRLTEEGFFMISGGGPGAMEATHLGAWMAGRSETEVNDALNTLASAPSFRDRGWLKTSFDIIQKYPQQHFISLGIPTWLYGHEPSTPFATHIAKLFENSIREDNILTYAYGGVIYTPGSAGTMQEIFQDAVQNHYLSFGFSSPMIFFGQEYWTKEIPVYTLLDNLVKSGKYRNLLLSLTDSQQDIIDTLCDFRDKTPEE